MSGLAVSLLLAALPALAAITSEDEAETVTPVEASVTATQSPTESTDSTDIERPRRRVEVLTANTPDDTTSERQAAMETRQAERAATQAERQATMEERRQEILTNQAERRATLTERAQTRIMNLAANISNRMEAALRRLKNVSARMNTRLDLLAERGVAVDAARIQLQVAEAEIASAYQTLTDIDTLVTNAVTSENPRQSWETVRTTYASARDDIRAAHQALREVLVLTKAATQSETTTATPAAIE